MSTLSLPASCNADDNWGCYLGRDIANYDVCHGDRTMTPSSSGIQSTKMTGLFAELMRFLFQVSMHAKNLGRNHPLTRVTIDSAVVNIWTMSARCLAHLEYRFLRSPLTQHYQLGFRPDLGLHRIYPPCF